LKMLNLSCLLIAGCNTEFCVESTVRDAYARDFDLIIFRDGVAGINPHFHKNSLDIFKAYFGEVLGLNEIQEMVR
ncbi:MAG: isochorismatase family protein, partial [Bdellovibrionales bacterium]|nr:isochorismatase family protein [Bdellovibrionales bacterium]